MLLLEIRNQFHEEKFKMKNKSPKVNRSVKLEEGIYKAGTSRNRMFALLTLLK